MTVLIIVGIVAAVAVILACIVGALLVDAEADHQGADPAYAAELALMNGGLRRPGHPEAHRGA